MWGVATVLLALALGRNSWPRAALDMAMVPLFPGILFLLIRRELVRQTDAAALAEAHHVPEDRRATVKHDLRRQIPVLLLLAPLVATSGIGVPVGLVVIGVGLIGRWASNYAVKWEARSHAHLYRERRFSLGDPRYVRLPFDTPRPQTGQENLS